MGRIRIELKAAAAAAAAAAVAVAVVVLRIDKEDHLYQSIHISAILPAAVSLQAWLKTPEQRDPAGSVRILQHPNAQLKRNLLEFVRFLRS